MYEVCFCGWSGHLEDRELVIPDDGERALQCPTCGHRDRLEWLREAARKGVLAEAARRLSRRVSARMPGQAA